jgi:hemolysin activation/secretion protein
MIMTMLNPIQSHCQAFLKQALTASLVARACLLSLTLHVSAAHAAEAATPNAGSLLNEIRPAQPATPVPTPRVLAPDATGVDSADQGARFMVKQLVLAGNQALSTEQLQAHLQAEFGTVEGSTVSMAQLRKMAASLTAFYLSQGYPFSRVVVPQQDVTNGTLTLQAVEARLGKLQIDSKGRISDATLNEIGAGLQPGADITQDLLDRTLLLMSDLPGAQVQATVKPGAKTGTSDLLVTHNTLPMFNARTTVDNHGNRNISRERVSAALTWLNISPVGDKASLDMITSGEGMTYARGAYERWLTGSGLTGGVQASYLSYRLGQDLRALQAHGTAETLGLWLRYPLLRTQRGSTDVQAGAEHVGLKDLVDSTSVRSTRSITRANVTLSGDRSGLLGSASQTSWAAQLTSGRVSFNDALAQASDSATAQTKGGYSKLELALSHRYALSSSDDLLMSTNGQQASKNLDSSQKWVIGGPGSVRAFDNSVASGDSGYTATIEWRHQVASFDGPITASLFYDMGHVTFNQTRWSAVTGASSVTLAGTGMGLSWAGRKSALSLSWATPTTGQHEPVVQGAGTGLVWLSAAFQL